MKKYRSGFGLFFLCISMVLVLNSCSSESAYVKNDMAGTEELSRMTPFKVVTQGSKATVGFIQTPVPFEFDLAVNNHQTDISLIESVIGRDIPLRVFVYQGTNSIAKVQAVSEQDIIDYRKDLVRADSEIMNRPDPLLVSIIPDEAMLDWIYYMIVNTACHPAAPMPGCLTFQFASDGCNARAHRMKQILNSFGYNCQKHYVFGGFLIASTSTCCVQWVYHTAPLVLFRNSNGVVEERILDPSLFSTPVTPEVWRAGCQNMSCVQNPDFEFGPVTYKTVPGIVFNYDPNSMSFLLDSDYARTECTLNTYQNQSGCAFPNPFPPAECQN